MELEIHEHDVGRHARCCTKQVHRAVHENTEGDILLDTQIKSSADAVNGCRTPEKLIEVKKRLHIFLEMEDLASSLAWLRTRSRSRGGCDGGIQRQPSHIPARRRGESVGCAKWNTSWANGSLITTNTTSTGLLLFHHSSSPASILQRWLLLQRQHYLHQTMPPVAWQ